MRVVCPNIRNYFIQWVTQAPALCPNMDHSHFMLLERRDPLTAIVLFYEHSCNPPQRPFWCPLPPDKFCFTGHVWPWLEWNGGRGTILFVLAVIFTTAQTVSLYEWPGYYYVPSLRGSQCVQYMSHTGFFNQWDVTLHRNALQWL